jgi:hypothetical protein
MHVTNTLYLFLLYLIILKISGVDTNFEAHYAIFSSHCSFLPLNQIPSSTLCI